MTGEADKGRRKAAILRATALVTEAIDLIDAYDGPPDAAGNLEIALQSLREAVSRMNA